MRIIFLLLCLCAVVVAQEQSVAPFFASSQILGMGNANISFVEDQEAMYYNPANLDVLDRNFHVSLGQTAITLDDNLMSFASLVLANSGNFKKIATEIEKVNTQFADIMSKYDQKYMNAQAQGDLSITIGQFGLGIWSKALVSAYYDDGIFIPYPLMKNQVEMTAQLSYGFRLFQNLSVGISPKYWVRVTDTAVVDLLDEDGLNNAVNSTDRFSRIADGEESIFDYDHLGLDLGFTYHLSNFRASLVLRDLLETSLNKDLSNESVRMSCDLGVGYRVVKLEEITKIKKLLFTAELKDAFNDKSFFTKLNLGGELCIFPFTIRGGITSGYFTYGATLQFIGVKFDFTSFATEGGEFAGIEEIRRYMFNIRLGI